jgi:hypothetical protein
VKGVKWFVNVVNRSEGKLFGNALPKRASEAKHILSNIKHKCTVMQGTGFA